MAKQLTYWDFGFDEYMYLTMAYGKGIRRSAMVAQAQHVAEYMMKELLSRRLLNNLSCMSQHNLRSLYDASIEAGIDLSPIRTHIMALNNFYNHTRYPGKDSYMATADDIELAVRSLVEVYKYVKELL